MKDIYLDGSGLNGNYELVLGSDLEEYSEM